MAYVKEVRPRRRPLSSSQSKAAPLYGIAAVQQLKAGRLDVPIVLHCKIEYTIKYNHVSRITTEQDVNVKSRQ